MICTIAVSNRSKSKLPSMTITLHLRLCQNLISHCKHRVCSTVGATIKRSGIVVNTGVTNTVTTLKHVWRQFSSVVILGTTVRAVVDGV